MEKRKIAEHILQLGYPELFVWEHPGFVESLGPHYPDAFRDFESQRSQAFDEAMKIMIRAPLTKLLAEYHQFRENIRITLANKVITDAFAIINKLNIPEWFKGGFGVVGRQADFNYWAKMGHLKLDEATAISIGFEPCGNIKPTDLKDEYSNNVAKFYENRRNLIARKFYTVTDESQTTVTPVELCDWAGDVNIEMPDGLYMEVGDLFCIDFKKTSAQEAPFSGKVKFDHREKASLAQLLTAIAMTEYGYVPDNARSPIPKEIQDICAKLGLDVSNDTIRKYLKLGASYLPDGWQGD